jgi:hypothetical protein
MTFVKGEPRPPNAGRRKGSRNKSGAYARRMAVEAEDREIDDTVIEAAKAGDHTAQALYYRHLRPPQPRLNPTPVDVPKLKTIEEVRQAVAELFVRVLAGEQDLDAAGVAASLLKAMESSIVGDDLAKLLADIKTRTGT